MCEQVTSLERSQPAPDRFGMAPDRATANASWADFLRPISIRVPVKLGLQYRFQVPLDYRLGDSVGDRGNSERSRLSGITLRNVND